MKKALCVFLALFLSLSLLSVPALADGEGSSFEPVTVADDESVKVVVTNLVNSPEDSSASFTLEITNKTDEGQTFYLMAFSVNDRICYPSWIELPPEDQGDDGIYIRAGEAESLSAGWDMTTLAQVGVNYVQSAEGYIARSWNYDAELSVPISLPFPAVEMDVPATEAVIYDTDFEPVTIIDDDGVTAIVHDYYVDEESGVSLVISVENRTGELLSTPTIQADIDGTRASANSTSRLIPPGKTFIETMDFTALDSDGWKQFTSVNSMDNITLLLGKYDSTPGSLYGDRYWDVELDVSPYADVTSSVHGTAAWVADPTPPETPQPTEEPVEVGKSSAETKSADLAWVPDPETDADAMVTLGDSGEYLLGIKRDSPGILFYLENINGAPISYIDSADVLINGEPVECLLGHVGMPSTTYPGGASNYAMGNIQPALPSGGFDMQIGLRLSGANSVLLDATVTVSFAEDGSATIEQVS